MAPPIESHLSVTLIPHRKRLLQMRTHWPLNGVGTLVPLEYALQFAKTNGMTTEKPDQFTKSLKSPSERKRARTLLNRLVTHFRRKLFLILANPI
jgi:hypothetical protein